jgi:hypothetical protein
MDVFVRWRFMVQYSFLVKFDIHAGNEDPPYVGEEYVFSCCVNMSPIEVTYF